MQRTVLMLMLACGLLLLAPLSSAAAPATLRGCDSAQDVVHCRAAQGDADAQYALGMELLEGEGREQDRMEALRWLSDAAKQEHPFALAVLARMSLSSQPGAACGG